MELAAKQAELARVEEAKKQEAQKGNYFLIFPNAIPLMGKGLAIQG